jgi:hypothetical protein
MELAALTKASRCRARRKAGLAVFTCTADEVSVKQMLEDANLLAASAWDDPAAVEKALTDFIQIVVKERL